MCTFNLRKYSKYYINENALSLWGSGLQIMKCTSDSQQNEIAVSRTMHRIAGFLTVKVDLFLTLQLVETAVSGFVRRQTTVT